MSESEKQTLGVRRPNWVGPLSLVLIATQIIGFLFALGGLVGYLGVGLLMILESYSIVALLVGLPAFVVSALTVAVFLLGSFRRSMLLGAMISTFAAMALSLVIDVYALIVVVSVLIVTVAGLLMLRYAGNKIAMIVDDECWLRYYHTRRLCWHCNYSLRGLTGSKCPECGAEMQSLNPPRMGARA